MQAWPCGARRGSVLDLPSMDKLVFFWFALAAAAAVVLGVVFGVVAQRHLRARTSAARDLVLPAPSKRAAKQLRSTDRRLASTGLVDERLFQRFRDAYDYDAASSVQWLEGRLKVLEERIRRGKKVRAYAPDAPKLQTLRTVDDFSGWVEQHFPGVRKSEWNAVSRFRRALADLDALSLRQRPPAERQIELGAALAESFEQMSRSDRDREQSELATSSVGKKILSLSGYLAETVVNKDDPTIVRIALMMHVVEGFHGDYRENIRYLILINHAARKMNIAIYPIILSASAFGSPQAQKRLEEFSQRADDLNSLASMGVREDGAPGEFRFVPA